MGSLGEAFGLGDKFYVGYDKHTVRLLLFTLGAPLLLVLVVAIPLLSHPVVGWSLARLDVWWAAHAASDEEYLRHGPWVVRGLKLVCVLPPALATLLGVAAWITMGAEWGLAGVTLLPALLCGGWTFMRARHVRWHYSPRVRFAGTTALGLILGGELVVALAPTTHFLVRATILSWAALAPLSLVAQLLAPGPALLTLEAVVHAFGGAVAGATNADGSHRHYHVPAPPVVPQLFACAVVYLSLMGLLVGVGAFTASTRLEALGVGALGAAVILFDSLALTYLKNRALGSPISLLALCGLQRALLIWPGPTHFLAGLTMIFFSHGLVLVHRTVKLAFPDTSPLQQLLMGPSSASAAAAKHAAEQAANAAKEVRNESESESGTCCDCWPRWLVCLPTAPDSSAPGAVELLSRAVGSLLRRADIQLLILFCLFTALMRPIRGVATSLPPVKVLDVDLAQDGAPWLAALVLVAVGSGDALWQLWAQRGFALTLSILRLAAAWELLLLVASFIALCLTGSWALFATGVLGGSFILLTLVLHRLWAAGDYAFLQDGPIFGDGHHGWAWGGYVLLGSDASGDVAPVAPAAWDPRARAQTQIDLATFRGARIDRDQRVGLLRLVRVSGPDGAREHMIARLWASTADAAARRPRDFCMVMGTSVLCGLLLLWGAIIDQVVSLGWAIALMIAECMLGLAGRESLYRRPEEPTLARACFGVLLALHLLYCGCFWLFVLGPRSHVRGSGEFQLLVLWLLVMPSATVLAYVLPEWQDMTVEKLPASAKYAVGGLGALALSFLAMLYSLYSRPLAIALAVILLLLCTLAVATLAWRSEGYLPASSRYTVLAAFGVVVFTGASIGIFSDGGAAYAGFSLCALSLTSTLGASAAFALTPPAGESWRSYHMPTVLPSYSLQGRVLHRADTAVECGVGAASLALCWAAYTMLTIQPKLIGATAGSIIQALAIHGAISALTQPLRELGALAHVITPRELVAARSEAELMHSGTSERSPSASCHSSQRIASDADETVSGSSTSMDAGSAPAGRRRQRAINLSDTSIAAQSGRVREALAQLHAAEAALEDSKTWVGVGGGEGRVGGMLTRRQMALTLPTLDERVAAEHEASAALSAHVHGLLVLNGRALLASKYAELTSFVLETTNYRMAAEELDELLDHEREELEARAKDWMETTRRKQALLDGREEEERLAAAARNHRLQRDEERTRRWSSARIKGKATMGTLHAELLDRWGQVQLVLKEVADVISGLSNLGGGANPPPPPPFTVSEVIAKSKIDDDDEAMDQLLEPSRRAARDETERLQAAALAWLTERQAELAVRIKAHRAALEGRAFEQTISTPSTASDFTKTTTIADETMSDAVGSKLNKALDDGSEYAQELQLELSLEQTRRSAKDANAVEEVLDTGHGDAVSELLRRQGAIESTLRRALAELKHYEQSTLQAYLESVKQLYAKRLREVDAARQLAEQEERRQREELAARRREEEERARLKREREEAEAEAERRRRSGDPMLSLVEPLLERCDKLGRPHVDDTFGGDAALPPRHRGKRWKRARELSRKAQIFASSAGSSLGGSANTKDDGSSVKSAGHAQHIDACDVQQGELGDCWFLSAIAVVAQSRPQLVQNCFVTQELHAHGVICCRFYKNGTWRHILIDDRFPCGLLGGLTFARSKQSHALWVSSLEKAYAKLHGSYAAIDGGFVDEALVDLTGGVGGERVQLQREAYNDMDGFWLKLMRYYDAGFLLGAGSPAGSDSETSALGIVQGHAYSLLAVREADGNRLVQLRNPWGSSEWRGDWSDRSPLWTARMKSRLNWSRSEDGVFWMCLDDFVRQYASLYVCKLPGDGWHEAIIRSEWRGCTAGGCSNHRLTYGKNPTFVLTIERPTHILVALAQDDWRLAAEREEPYAIGIGLLQGRLFSRVPGADSGAFSPVREVSFDAKLSPQAGKKTDYYLRPCTFDPNEECGFTLRVYSDQAVELRQR